MHVKNQKGAITLKELLWGVAITGLIAAVAAVALVNARTNNRDNIRVSNIIQIQNGLELYFFNCNKYPVEVKAEGVIGDNECGGPYLSYVPADPENGMSYKYTPCSGAGPYKCEAGTKNASSYELIYELESGTGRVSGGMHVARPGKLY